MAILAPGKPRQEDCVQLGCIVRPFFKKSKKYSFPLVMLKSPEEPGRTEKERHRRPW